MPHVPRLFLPEVHGPGPVQLDSDQAKRLGTVMRAKPGDSVLVFPGDGREWNAIVSTAARGKVLLEVHEIIRQEPAPAVHIDVCMGMVRPNRMDLVIEKCTEAGASLFRPLVCEYTQRHAESADRLARWQRIAIEASEQSGRLSVPQFSEPAAFERWVRLPGATIVYGERDGRTPIELEPLLPATGTVSVAVGPEGGFSPTELDLLRSAGGIAASFGPGILRTETAAIAGTLFVRSMRP